LLTFYFTMMIMNRLLFANGRLDPDAEADADASLERIDQP